MLTKEQALTADEFHYGTCKRTVGPRGGNTLFQERWRRNGQTQTWKTRPNDFRIPIKFGMYDYSAIWHSSAADWHTVEDCPLLRSEGEFLVAED